MVRPARGNEADAVMGRNLKQQQDFGFSADKMFYRIGDVGKMVGVETCVLRYWESEFEALSPRRARSGQRIYTAEDIAVLLHIKRLLYEERYTIDGAKKKLTVMLPDIKKQAVTDEATVTDPGDGDVVGMVQQRLRRILERLS
jgi:DNA-binding transcriptional MerR regulator